MGKKDDDKAPGERTEQSEAEQSPHPPRNEDPDQSPKDGESEVPPG